MGNGEHGCICEKAKNNPRTDCPWYNFESYNNLATNKEDFESPKNFTNERPNRSSQLAITPVANEPTDKAIASQRR